MYAPLPSRRQLLGAAAAAPLAIGAMRAPAAPALVDVHVHLTQGWNQRRALTAPQLLRWMDAHRISHALVLPLVSPEAWFYPITTDWVLQQTQPFRERLIPFCAVDPRTGVYGGKEYFVDILARYQTAGARGMGEHKWGGAIDDPQNIQLMRACAQLQLPVLMHLDNQRNTDRPGLPGLERLIQAVPELTLIGHGPGWWASISGDVRQADFDRYPPGPIAPGGALDRLLEKYPQLYADLSAGSGHNAMRRDPEFASRFLARRADQLLFGTDLLAADQHVPQLEWFASQELDDRVREKISRTNALRLIGEPVE